MRAVALAALATFSRAASADLRTDLATVHDAASCVRCQPTPKAAESVADVVRRLRGQPAPSPATRPAAKTSDIAADVKHVLAASADDQPRQAMRIAEDLVQSDVRAAAAFAAALPVGRAQDGALLVVLSVWVRADRHAALRWAIELTKTETRSAAIREVARRLVAGGAREAAEFALTLPEDGERDEALVALAQHWSKIDRPAALAWANGLAESSAKTSILAALAE